MKRTLSYTITNKNKADTIGAFLHDAGYSRRILIELKQNPEQICLNGTPSWLNTPLQIGDTLTLFLPDEPFSSDILPVNLPIDIVYEDEDLIILNKATGMPVHPSQGHHENTLANALAYRFASRGEHFVFRAVNRLDRDTTGLLLIAKHKISGAFLSAMTAKKEIRREYLAIVAGKPEESGTIDLPIARKDSSTIERCIDMDHGEHAVTHYRCLDYRDDLGCSLVRLRLETGRTHQIRVHMKAIGHPLLGDFLYNPDYRFIGRQALHSYTVAFRHPITGEAMEFTGSDAGGFFLLLLILLPQSLRIMVFQRPAALLAPSERIPVHTHKAPAFSGVFLRKLDRLAAAGMPPSPARRQTGSRSVLSSMVQEQVPARGAAQNGFS